MRAPARRRRHPRTHAACRLTARDPGASSKVRAGSHAAPRVALQEGHASPTPPCTPAAGDAVSPAVSRAPTDTSTTGRGAGGDGDGDDAGGAAGGGDDAGGAASSGSRSMARVRAVASASPAQVGPGSERVRTPGRSPLIRSVTV